MINFKTIRWKNFLSAGDSFIEIPLDTSQITLISGSNGAGKCLHSSTNVVVRIGGEDSTEIKTLTIKEIYDLSFVENGIRDFFAQTRFGFKRIEWVDITQFDSQMVEITTSTERKVISSPDHLFFSENGGWKKACEFFEGELIATVDGLEAIASITDLSGVDDLYDLQIEDVKEFYANGFVSHNSTMIEALSFSLFGKPYRNINKPQLVNSINKKGTVTEVEFSVGSREYKVVRGLKPAVFEIWENGRIIDQSSKSKDYQQFLERNILKLNHKSFHQIVVLGSSSFIPFMQLPANARREVIEDLLDIKIFSHMRTILKERHAKNKAALVDIDKQISIAQAEIDSHSVYYRKLLSMKSDIEKQNDDEVDEIDSMITDLSQQKKDLLETIESITAPGTNLEKLTSDREELLTFRSQFKTRIKSIVRDAKFFSENSECPTCNQPIDDDFKAEKLSIGEKRAKELNEAFNQTEKRISKIEKEIASHQKVKDEINRQTREISSLEERISDLLAQKDRVLKRISQSSSNVENDIAEAKEKTDSLKQNHMSLKELRLREGEERQYLEASMEMLKDTGIKTKVVDEYLPVINQLVNKYLQTMDFFASFHLNSSFSEEIRSRHLDTFTYSSFSEGEKQKIDISLLFAWRQIARMKNSASTNLLILDEVGDSSLDSSGLDALMNILNTAEKNTNVFIISHRENQLDGLFDSKITFHKEKNFTKVNFS